MPIEEIVRNVFQRLPIAMIFLAIIDFIIGEQLVTLYLGQLKEAEPSSKYTLIAFFFLVGVNFIVMITTFLTSKTAKKLDTVTVPVESTK